MVSTLPEVFGQAEADFNGGRYQEALRGYLALIHSAPRFTRARYRVADTLLNLGDRQRAKDVYKALAWHYIRAGYPLLGLVVCKMVIALDPSYDDLLYILAELYSSESDRVGDIDLPEPPPLPDGAPAVPFPGIEAPLLFETAAKAAADTDPITETPTRFPQIPLFSHLGEDAFIKVLGSLKLRRFTHSDPVVREGEPGDSFFMLADGVVTVSKSLNGQDTILARLHQGAVFGEMALVSNAPRAATVTAVGDVDLLELTRRDLETHAGELESVKQALKKFTRGRFLANLAATSPMFRNLERPERRALMAAFRPQKVYAGDIIIEEGEAGRGLYLILRGDFEVTAKGEGDRAVPIARLGSGEVFGEISLLRNALTTATVTARSIGELLFLPKEDFRSMLAQHPKVRDTLDKMSEARLRERFDATSEVVTDDDLVMI